MQAEKRLTIISAASKPLMAAMFNKKAGSFAGAGCKFGSILTGKIPVSILQKYTTMVMVGII